MTRERIVGLLLGISIGTFVGYYLLPAQTTRPQVPSRPSTEKAEELIIMTS
jgi:hypothetical protein